MLRGGANRSHATSVTRRAFPQADHAVTTVVVINPEYIFALDDHLRFGVVLVQVRGVREGSYCC